MNLRRLEIMFLSLCLLYLCLGSSASSAYVWVFRLLCSVYYAFAWFVPMSGSFAFSAVSAVGSSPSFAELLVRFTPVFPSASECKF